MQKKLLYSGINSAGGAGGSGWWREGEFIQFGRLRCLMETAWQSGPGSVVLLPGNRRRKAAAAPGTFCSRCFVAEISTAGSLV